MARRCLPPNPRRLVPWTDDGERENAHSRRLLRVQHVSTRGRVRPPSSRTPPLPRVRLRRPQPGGGGQAHLSAVPPGPAEGGHVRRRAGKRRLSCKRGCRPALAFPALTFSALLQDAFLRGHTASDIGRAVILPSSYVGSPRYYHQLYQDIMAVVAKLGKPDLFVTFTCNPDWPEIRAELLGRQSPADRPDLCARVFHMKVRVGAAPGLRHWPSAPARPLTRAPCSKTAVAAGGPLRHALQGPRPWQAHRPLSRH
jgi:hypothetical protein